MSYVKKELMPFKEMNIKEIMDMVIGVSSLAGGAVANMIYDLFFQETGIKKSIAGFFISIIFAVILTPPIFAIFPGIGQPIIASAISLSARPVVMLFFNINFVEIVNVYLSNKLNAPDGDFINDEKDKEKGKE